MSFWEDRFVDRPHASAIPANEPADLDAPDTSADPNGLSEGRAWSDVSEPDADVGAQQPFGFGYRPSEETPDEDMRDEEPTEDAEADESPAVEYRRAGILRRRRPVPADAEAEVEAVAEGTLEVAEAEIAEPERDDGPAGFAGDGHSWSVVETPVEAEVDLVEEIADADETPAVEYRRAGIFRRRRPVPVEAEAEIEVEDEDAVVEHDADWQAYEALAAFAAVETEEAPAEPRRRGLFRRRREPVEKPFADDLDWDGEPDELQLEPAAVEAEAELVLAPELDEEELAPAKPRRGLFRRRKTESLPTEGAEAEAEDADPDALDSVEDDAFENVTLYPAYSAPAVYAQADEGGEAGEQDVPDDDSHTEPEPVVAESDEGAAVEEPAGVEYEAAASADEPAFVEPVDEPVVEESEHELAPEHEPAEDAEPALPVLNVELHDAEPSATDPFADEYDQPAPLRKRNGRGGARGKKVVGLKVGASQIAAAVVTGNGDSPALVDIARRPLEQGVVVDGELRDPEALARALKAFFKDHDLPAKNVRLGLSSSRVGVRTFDIAGVDEGSRFDNAVRFKAHEVLPVAAHESALDYRVVEERYTESGEISRRVLLVVAPRDQVEPYIEACRSAGLRLAGVDLEAFGLLRAFVPPLGARSRTEDSATVVAAIGHEASTLLVAGGGICEFTRVFDWGGGALQEAIAEELEVPLMEAATILTHLSLSGPGRHLDSLDSDARGRALQAVRARLMPFARELVSSLQFYQTQPESLGIREILITGGTSHLEGLADALHQMIGVSVRVGDPLGRVTVQTEIPSALDAQIGSLAVPIGLAIEDDPARSVNLLPKDARQTRKRPKVLAVAAPLAAAVPLAALAFLFVQATGTVGDRQTELDAVRGQIAALPEPTRPNIDPALAGEQAMRATAVAQILGGRLSWERVLGDISRVLPAGVSLTELVATTPQPTTPEVAATTDGSSTATPPPVATTPTTPTGVTVIGYALEYATIARTLARIQAVPSLTNAQLQSATPATLGKKRVIEFTIVADLATPGGAQ